MATVVDISVLEVKPTLPKCGSLAGSVLCNGALMKTTHSVISWTAIVYCREAGPAIDYHWDNILKPGGYVIYAGRPLRTTS